MAKINNDEFYPLTPAIDGMTSIASMPNGDTVQYDVLETMRAVLLETDFINVNKATRIGQHVIINDPNDIDTEILTINSGKKAFGTINNTVATFPPTADTEIDFITKFR